MHHNIDLAKHRLQTAEECLQAAKKNLAINEYKTAVNRSYYCIFNAMRSVMALYGEDFKSHTGLIKRFREEFIKTGIFSKEMNKTINELIQVRNSSDYDDFYIVDKASVAQQIEKAESFLRAVSHYITNDYSE